jgi:hypothetical protein
MYQNHNKIETPPDETTVYRYMSFAKFVYLLWFKQLYFARLDRLDDEMEGIVDDVRLRDKHRECYLRINKYVNCWHTSDYESEAMWKLYGGAASESVAISSSIGRIKEAIAEDPNPVYIGRVHYEKKPDEEYSKNFYVQVYHKRRMYAHEQELRLCVSGSNDNPPAYLLNPPAGIQDNGRLSRFFVDDRHPDKVLVRVDLSRLILEVVVGDPWLEPLTQKLVHSVEGLAKCRVIPAMTGG